MKRKATRAISAAIAGAMLLAACTPTDMAQAEEYTPAVLADTSVEEPAIEEALEDEEVEENAVELVVVDDTEETEVSAAVATAPEDLVGVWEFLPESEWVSVQFVEFYADGTGATNMWDDSWLLFEWPIVADGELSMTFTGIEEREGWRNQGATSSFIGYEIQTDFFLTEAGELTLGFHRGDDIWEFVFTPSTRCDFFQANANYAYSCVR